MKVVIPRVELVCATENPELLIERAGRTCYKSEGQIGEGSAERLIKMIMKRGHLSVIEHASATIKIVCDRGVDQLAIIAPGEFAGQKLSYKLRSVV